MANTMDGIGGQMTSEADKAAEQWAAKNTKKEVRSHLEPPQTYSIFDLFDINKLAFLAGHSSRDAEVAELKQRISDLMAANTFRTNELEKKSQEIERLRGEASRWKHYPAEVPQETGEYIVVIDDNDNCGPYITSHLYATDCGWSIQIGQSLKAWMPR